MHTINLTQRFLANQPWKNPHGENQSERGEIFIISSAMYRTENTQEILLISTTDFYLKNLNTVLSKNTSRTLKILCLNFADRTVVKPSRTSSKTVPNKCCSYLENCAGNLMQPYLDFCAVINDRTSISVQH